MNSHPFPLCHCRRMRKRGITGNAYPWLHNWRERRERARIQIVTLAEIRAQVARHHDQISRAVASSIANRRACPESAEEPTSPDRP